MPRQWYVVRSEPRAEYMAASELDRAGFEVLLPRAKTPNPRNGHTDIPLFPGYLFLRCDLAEEAPPIRLTAPHVSGWVSFDGVVPSLPDDFVSSLMLRLTALSEEGGLWRRFRRGEKVQVVTGSLHELAEVVEEPKSPQARVRVLMEFMGGVVTANVPWENLRAVEDEPNLPIKSHRRTRGRGRWIRGFGPQAAPLS